jgi:NADPH2:quinone reductase
LRPRATPEKAAIAAEMEARVWPLLVSGTVHPVIDSVFPLQQAAAAHMRLESGLHVGKVMLTVGQPAA